MVSSAVQSDLAPTGTIRAGINYGNPVLARRDPARNEIYGVAVDLARELGKHADMPVALIGFDAAGKLFDAVRTGAWDVAFLAIDPARSAEVEFTAPYVEIEGTYLSGPNSPLRDVQDVDRKGVRIGVSADSAYDLFLRRSIKNAELVHAPGPEASFELILKGTVDIVAGVRQALLANQKRLPGSRVFAGRFMAIGQAAAVPKRREVGASFLSQFIEDMKASGFVAAALTRAGIQGVTVAPPANPQRRSAH
jgi:polar amino acid transport system substrate-binding protein